MKAMRPNAWSNDSRSQFKYWCGALLIHAVIGVLLVGFNWRTQQAVVPQLAINAVLVDRNTLNQVARKVAPPAPATPAPAEPEDTRQKELEQKQREQEQVQQKQEQLKREQLELQRVQDQQRLVAEAEKKKLQDQQRKAQEAEQKKQQQEAEKKRLADIQQKQRETELKRQADAEAKAQATKEAELKAQLAAEEGATTAVNAGLLNVYVGMISQKVMRNWIKPPTAKQGLECEVKVSQAQGGTVLSVEVGRCNGDAAVRSSIEAAVQRASPLPSPPDPRLFQRNLLFIFKPTE